MRVQMCYSRSHTIGGDDNGYGAAAAQMDVDEDFIIDCDVSLNGHNEAPGVFALKWQLDTGSPELEPWHDFSAPGSPHADEVEERLAQDAWEAIIAVEDREGNGWEAAFEHWGATA